MWSTVCCAFAAHLPAGTLASGATRPHHAKQRENLLAEQHNSESAKRSLPRINQEKLLNRQDGRSFVSSCYPLERKKKSKKKRPQRAKRGGNFGDATIPLHNFHSLPCKTPSLFSVPYVGLQRAAVACGFRLRPVVSLRCLTSPPVTQHRCE